MNVNLTNSEDRTLLHLVMLETTVSNRPEITRFLLNNGADVNLPDLYLDTPLTLVRHVMEKDDFSLALTLAEILIRFGADVDHRNKAGWSLLSCSVQHLDSSIHVSRLLLNSGASFLPRSFSHSHKPFAVFLRSVIRQQSLENTEELLRLIGTSLSDKPAEMRTLVNSVLVSETRFPSTIIPELMLQVRRRLEVYWLQPLPLSTLCLNQVRKKIGAKRLNSETLAALKLPARIEDYLKLKRLSDFCLPKTRTEKTERILKPGPSPSLAPLLLFSNLHRIQSL